MKSCGNLSLKNSYKHLQKKMWEISEKAHQIDKENQFLKGKINTQRIMIQKRKNQTSYMQSIGEQREEGSNVAKNVDKAYQINADLKKKLNSLEEQKKKIQEELSQMDRLHKKHKLLQEKLTKISKILKKGEKKQVAELSCNQLEKEQVMLGGKLELAEKEQEEIVKCIRSALAEVEEEKRTNKILSSEVLSLIEQKSCLKKIYKSQKNNEQAQTLKAK